MAIMDIKRNPTINELNRFGLYWMLFFGSFGAVAFFKSGTQGAAPVLWGLALVVPCLGWIFPRFMRIAFLGLSYLAFPVGFVISHLILALVYYIMFTLVAVFMKVFRYDSMKRHADPDEKSYWIRRDSVPSTKRYFRQY